MKPVYLSTGRPNSCEGLRQVTRSSESPSEANDLRGQPLQSVLLPLSLSSSMTNQY
jgi:hypothetical protein